VVEECDWEHNGAEDVTCIVRGDGKVWRAGRRVLGLARRELCDGSEACGDGRVLKRRRLTARGRGRVEVCERVGAVMTSRGGAAASNSNSAGSAPA
jgi:hypothetical protein